MVNGVKQSLLLIGRLWHAPFFSSAGPPLLTFYFCAAIGAWCLSVTQMFCSSNMFL